MTKTMFFYVFLSIIVGVFIYFITLIEITNTRTTDAYYTLAEQALASASIDDFVKFSASGFERIDQYEDETYVIDILHVQAFASDVEYHQLGIFVIPKVDIPYATEVEDVNDLTRAIVMSNEQVLFDTATDDSLSQYAMSYGINEIGFYFYAFEFDDVIEGSVTLKDYNNTIIYEETLTVSMTYDANAFVEGYTQEEIEAIINAEAEVETTLIERLTLFIVVDVILGTLLYYVIKALRRPS